MAATRRSSFKPCKTALALTMMTFALTVRSDNRTWDGGGGDANWSTVTNWNGDVSAPGTGDALFFDGSARLVNTNDLTADTSFAGLTFNSGAGAFALGGNRIALDGNVTNWSTSTQALNLPMILSGTRAFSASNGAITVNGALSGTGGLTKFGTKTLTLTASSSYDGVTTVSNGLLAIYHSNALGSTNGNTWIDCSSGGYLQLYNDIQIAEPLTFNSNRGGGYTLQNASGSNTLNGALTLLQSGFRISVPSGTTLVVGGGVKSSSDIILNNGGTLVFNNTPLNLGGGAFYVDASGGTVAVGVAGNIWSYTLVTGGVRLDITNALPASTDLRIGVGYNQSGTLNLNGNNQLVGKLSSPVTNTGTRIVTSATPATLTVNQSDTSTYEGRLTGMLSLIKTGTGTLTLSNSLSTATGDITVSNGTLVVALGNSLGGSTNIAVIGAAATLELRTSSGIADTASLSIADGGAKVNIGTNFVEAVGRLYLNGVQQMSGTWGKDGSGATHIDNAHFAGAGVLNVLNSPTVNAVNAVWDAEGADTLMSTTNNWAGDTLPAFDGTTYAVFSSGGTTATVDTAVNLYGMAFNSSNNFVLANGNGSVTLGVGGISAAVTSTVSRAYTLAEDLSLTDSQVWNITNNGAATATLTVSGSIRDGNSLYSLTKTGNGTLVLSGSNTYHGVTTVKAGAGVLRITNANALGSTNGATMIEDGGGWLEVSGGIAVAEPLTINGDVSTGYAGVLRSTGGSNIWSGGIVHINSRITCTSGSLDLLGGVTGSSFVLAGSPGTFIRVAEKPVAVGGGRAYSHTSGAVILAVSNNVWSQLEVSGNIVRTDVANALPPAGALVFVGNSGLDMNGCNQTIGKLTNDLSAAGNRTVRSVAPATLTVNQSDVSTFSGCITGAVSLVKTGSGTLTLSGTNTTFGGFTVSTGTLVVASSGVIVNSTNVMVTGTGTLTLQTSTGIADTAALRIENGSAAKVRLDAGVNEKVGWLYFGDKMQRAGTYSAASAQVIDTVHFAGTGVLTVLHDKSGTLIKLN